MSHQKYQVYYDILEFLDIHKDLSIHDIHKIDDSKIWSYLDIVQNDLSGKNKEKLHDFLHHINIREYPISKFLFFIAISNGLSYVTKFKEISDRFNDLKEAGTKVFNRIHHRDEPIVESSNLLKDESVNESMNGHVDVYDID